MADPVGIADCTVWLDADQDAYADGALVSTWTDRSGAGNHATASGSVRPTFRTNQRNGLPALRFAGGHRLDLPAGIFDSAGGTTFFVGQFENRNTGYMISSASTDGCGSGQLRHRWYLFASSGNAVTAIGRDFCFHEAIWGASLPIPDDGWFAGSLWTDGITGALRISCVGFQSSPFSDGPYEGAGARAHLGMFLDTFTEPMTGAIGEILHYDRALTDDEIDDVQRYLAEKWDVLCGVTGWQVGKVGIAGGIGIR